MIDLSVITVCYNSQETILDTVDSIQSQTFDNYEYIVIDGLSKDRTLDILEKNFTAKQKLKIVSEQDEGIYDAMNKGISLAKGKFISILNSNDTYFDQNVLKKIMSMALF